MIGIPLKEGDADPELDVPEVLVIAFNHATNDLQIDYRSELRHALEFAERANALLVSNGLRPR